MDVSVIRAFTDNCIWLMSKDGIACAVDPGQAQPLIDRIRSENLHLSDILVTHGHPDHVGGLPALCAEFPELRIWCRAQAQAPESFKTQAWMQHLPPHHLHELSDGQVFSFGGSRIQTLYVPGHTQDHVAYLLTDQGQQHLFPGDTLFSLGCGRVLDGSMSQLFQSLRRLRALPGDTLIYPAHEYTLSNLRFATHLRPHDPDLRLHGQSLQSRWQSEGRTLPARLSDETRFNPFLRDDDEQWPSHSAQAFSILRQMKDQFQ